MARQKRLEGVEDECPEAVATAAESYLKFKRATAAAREKANGALDVLIEQMKTAGLKQIKVDDGEKRLVLSSKDLVKIQKLKKADED
jgi:hypothetical protein